MKAQETGGVRWKIRTKHRKTEELPFHAWWWSGEPVKADTLGRRNDRMWQAQWARVTCLYEECPAEALIRIADMVELLPVPEVKARRVTPAAVPDAPGSPSSTSQVSEAHDPDGPSEAN